MKYLALAWALAAWLLFTDTRVVRDYLSLTGGMGVRGEAPAATPLRQTYPHFAADAHTWVRHALSLAEGNGPRLRHTGIDNAPYGREVHWNSAWAWTIAAAGHVYQAVARVPFANAVERATLWLNPLALLVAIVVLSSWASRHLGLAEALFVSAALTLHERLLEGFFPGYVDHHGLLAVSVMGTLLGAFAMARGSRAGARMSALCGAFGMWVSAASVLPAIAAVGLAGAAVTAWRREEPALAWRTWGTTGAAASLLFYVLEYFPQHMALRLETNHPLYAIAWLAAGELLARMRETPPRTPAARAWPWIALLALPATVAMGGARVLSFTEDFMQRLHANYIHEFLPMWASMQRWSVGSVIRGVVLETVPLAAALATVACLRRRTPTALAFMAMVAAALLAMAWWQTRWMLNASAAQVCLVLALAQAWTAGEATLRRGIVLAALAAMLYVPGAVERFGKSRESVDLRQVSRNDAGVPLARDIAAALRASQPRGDIVVLASPDASTLIGYYGRFATLGTLYWENAAGLKAAAAMFSARDDREAERLLRERRVTHIAMVSQDDFIAPYYELLHPGAAAAEIETSFGWRLLKGHDTPDFLEEIPYEAPPDLRVLETTVRLYALRPGKG